MPVRPVLIKKSLAIKWAHVCKVSEFQKKFDKAIIDIVSNIPKGRVMSYGEVARAAGFPRHARMVSKAMSRSRKPLPWFRVVRADRTLAFAPDSEYYIKQKMLLSREGVIIKKGKVIPLQSDKNKSLDKLLWGPE